MIELPGQERVYEAIHKVQSLSAKEIDQRIATRIGDPMMAGFAMVAKKLVGDNPDEKTLATRVQLMVYSYLLCTEAFAELFAEADKKK